MDLKIPHILRSLKSPSVFHPLNFYLLYTGIGTTHRTHVPVRMIGQPTDFYLENICILLCATLYSRYLMFSLRHPYS